MDPKTVERKIAAFWKEHARGACHCGLKHEDAACPDCLAYAAAERAGVEPEPVKPRMMVGTCGEHGVVHAERPSCAVGCDLCKGGGPCRPPTEPEIKVGRLLPPQVWGPGATIELTLHDHNHGWPDTAKGHIYKLSDQCCDGLGDVVGGGMVCSRCAVIVAPPKPDLLAEVKAKLHEIIREYTADNGAQFFGAIVAGECLELIAKVEGKG